LQKEILVNNIFTLTTIETKEHNRFYINIKLNQHYFVV